MKKTLFITFEGIDGCGKTTQVAMLKEYLYKLGLKSLFIKEPGGTDLGEEIRTLIKNNNKVTIGTKAEFLLFNAARAELCETVISPAIQNQEYDFIICDRFYDSTFAYQCYANDAAVDLSVAKTIINFATCEIVPDITFLLKLSAEEADNRKTMRCEQGQPLDRIENKGLGYQKRVADGYDILAQENKNRFKLINANQSIEEIFKDIMTELKKHLN